jgi:phosphoglycerate kinase
MASKPREGKIIQSIRDLDLGGRHLFLRADLDVPMVDGTIADETLIKKALPTIEYAMQEGAFIVLASHLGSPKEDKKKAFSMEPVAARIAELLDCEVLLADDCIGYAVRKVIADIREGQIAMLENLRFHPGEESDDESFARDLAKPVDLYANNAFRPANHAYASIHALPKLMSIKAMGLLFEGELSALNKVRDQPVTPYVAILGGSTLSDKIGLIEKLLENVNTLLIGGALANTFLAAKGYSMGRSQVENNKRALARSLLDRADLRNIEVSMPEDLLVGDSLEAESGRIVKSSEVPEGSYALDIGPQTVKQYREKILRSNTVFWNGPMGICERRAFAKGTVGISEALRDCRGYTVVAGSNTAAAIRAAGLNEGIDHISTGADTSLEFIEGRQLPGIQALASIK